MEHVDCESSCQTEPDLLYLNILNETVKATAAPDRQHTTLTAPPAVKDTVTPRSCLSAKLPQLSDIDYEYLAKKGVFDLPPSRYL